MALLVFLLSYLALASAQKITVDYNCTEYTPNGFVYTWQAVGCNDVLSESYCKEKYNNYVYPAVGGGWNRAQACYASSTEPFAPRDEAAKSYAISFCPKTCGFCCETREFSCMNKNEKIACDTVTQAQCKDLNWRHFLADQCPGTCGYCFYNECVDLAECTKDMCNMPTLQEFVNWNCRFTCKKCEQITTSTTTRGPSTKLFTRPLIPF